jgi:hypothetical protein
VSEAPRLLDAEDVIADVLGRLPPGVLGNVVVIGSIAAAWSFRDLEQASRVSTKDIDILLRPAVEASGAASEIAEALLAEGWEPYYPRGVSAADARTPDEHLPALRLRPPEVAGGWFLELIGEPDAGQVERRAWRRFETSAGHFGLPSFRFLRVATHGAVAAGAGLRIAHPAAMALANLLEHADPDQTVMSASAVGPGMRRFEKDVGRAVALWWLATQQAPEAIARTEWNDRWSEAASDLRIPSFDPCAQALALLEDGDTRARALLLASTGMLAGTAITHAEYAQAWQQLCGWVGNLPIRPPAGE